MREEIILFKYNSVDSLFVSCQDMNRRDAYFSNDLRFADSEEKVTISVEINSSLPSLNDFDNKSDAKNAVAIYESFGDIGLDFSIDERLWASMCHIYYPDYVFNRWIKDKEGQDLIRSRYFTLAFGSDRALARNAISRLWFGAFLTVNKNEKELEYFFEGIKDKFLYTKTLFSYGDIQTGLLERSLGRNKKIALSVLYYFEKNKKNLNKERILDSLKKVCLLNQHIKLHSIEAEDIDALYKKYLPI